MGEGSFFRNPRKQIYLVTFLFAAVYIWLVIRTGGVTPDDIMVTILAFMYGLVSLTGLMGGEIAALDLIPPSMRAILRDGAAFLIVFLAGLAFYAQFVLPLHRTRDRWHAFTRLLFYVFRRHGPAIAIVNGESKATAQELERRGRGVILLDTASAAVLRTATKFTRPVGPGAIFTRKGEQVGNAFSLQLQRKILGPLRGENPFTEKSPEESDQEHTMRTERRWETRGLTRDGAEVVPTIVTIFKLDCAPRTGDSWYGFEESPVWKANGLEGIDPKKGIDTQQRKVRWDWLPAYMAAELWREYLGKFTLQELFASPNQTVEETGFQRIERLINARLTKPRVEQLNDLGKPSGQRKTTSQEYMQLRERGLTVKKVFISDIFFPREIEERLINQWKDRWQDLARESEMRAQQLRSKTRIEGEEAALKAFAEQATLLLGDHLIHHAPTPDKAPTDSQALELLVRSTVDLLVQDDVLRSQMTNEKQDLVEIVEWVRRNR